MFKKIVRQSRQACGDNKSKTLKEMKEWTKWIMGKNIQAKGTARIWGQWGREELEEIQSEMQ